MSMTTKFQDSVALGTEDHCESTIKRDDLQTRNTEEFGPILLYVVDSAEKWKPANEIRYSYGMQMGAQAVTMDVCAISMADYEAIEIQHASPVWLHDGEPPGDFKKIESDATQAKKIAILELSLGKKLPGATLDDKIAWMNDRSAFQIEQLDRFIRFYACAFADRTSIPRATFTQESQPVAFTSFDQWTSAASTSHFFRMDRIGQDHLIEFPLRGISNATVQSIREKYVPPEAPMILKKNAQGVRTGENIRNINDASYIRAHRANSQKSNIAWLTEALQFSIPGVNDLEKMNWVYARPVGEVFRLVQFIQNEVAQFSGGTDFFEKRTSLKN